jgi:enoyl-CoA hydratase
MDPEVLAVTDDGPIRTLTLQRPSVRNAINLELRRGLVEALTNVDPGVDVIIVTGADPAFCAGVDLKEDVPAELRRTRPHPPEAALACPTPIIGAINGACVTGGLALMLAFDIVIASEHAWFADTHARLGAVAGWGMSAQLSDRVGRGFAKEMSATARRVEAHEALNARLVDHVVAHDDLLPRAHELAQEISKSSSEAVRVMFSLYDKAIGLTLEERLEREQEAIMADPERRAVLPGEQTKGSDR